MTAGAVLKSPKTKSLNHAAGMASPKSDPTKDQALVKKTREYTYTLKQALNNFQVRLKSLDNIVPEVDSSAQQFSEIGQTLLKALTTLADLAPDHKLLKHLKHLKSTDITCLLSAPRANSLDAYTAPSRQPTPIIFSKGLLSKLCKLNSAPEAFEQFAGIFIHEACHIAFQKECEERGQNNLADNSVLQEQFCDLQVQIMFLLGLKPSALADALKNLPYDPDQPQNLLSPYLKTSSRITLLESAAIGLAPLDLASADNQALLNLNKDLRTASAQLNSLVKNQLQAVTVTSHLEDYFDQVNLKSLSVLDAVRAINSLCDQIHDMQPQEHMFILEQLKNISAVPDSLDPEHPALIKLTQNLLTANTDLADQLLKNALGSSIKKAEVGGKISDEFGAMLVHTKLILNCLEATSEKQIVKLHLDLIDKFWNTEEPVVPFLSRELAGWGVASLGSRFAELAKSHEADFLDGKQVELPGFFWNKVGKQSDKDLMQHSGFDLYSKEAIAFVEFINRAVKPLLMFTAVTVKKEILLDEKLIQAMPLIPGISQYSDKENYLLKPDGVIRIKPPVEKASADTPMQMEYSNRQEEKFFQSLEKLVPAALEELSNTTADDILAFAKKHADILYPHPTFLNPQDREQVDPHLKVAQIFIDRLFTLARENNRFDLLNDFLDLEKNKPGDFFGVERVSPLMHSAIKYRERKVNNEILSNAKTGVPHNHPYLRAITDKNLVTDSNGKFLVEPALIYAFIAKIQHGESTLSTISETSPWLKLLDSFAEAKDIREFVNNLPRKTHYSSKIYTDNSNDLPTLLKPLRDRLISEHLAKQDYITSEILKDLKPLVGNNDTEKLLLHKVKVCLELKPENQISTQELVADYRNLESSGYFISFPDKRSAFEQLITERLQALPSSEVRFSLLKKLAHIEIEKQPEFHAPACSYSPNTADLYFERNIVAMYSTELQQKMLRDTGSAIDRSNLEIIGEDVAVVEFVNLWINEVKQCLPAILRYKICEEFADRICSQEQISILLEEASKDNTYGSYASVVINNAEADKINIASHIIESAVYSLKQDQQLRDAYIDFFANPYSAEKGAQLLESINAPNSRNAMYDLINLFGTFSNLSQYDIRSILSSDNYKEYAQDLLVKTHTRLRESSYAERAVFLRLAISADAFPADSEQKKIDKLTDYILHKIIPEDQQRAKITVFCRNYLSAGWKGNYNQAALILAGFLGSGIDQADNTLSEQALLGQRVVKFLIAHKNAGYKICQRIHSIPDIDPEFSAQFAFAKEESDRIPRAKLFRLIKEYGPEGLFENGPVHVGRASPASINISAPLTYDLKKKNMLGIIMPGARINAISWLNNFKEAVLLSQDEISELKYLLPVLDEAVKTIADETDYDKAVWLQQALAETQLNNISHDYGKCEVVTTVAALVRAKNISGGTPDTDSGYKETEFCEGRSFNELKRDISTKLSNANRSKDTLQIQEARKDLDNLRYIAMDSVVETLAAIIAGSELESDQHGGQQKNKFEAGSDKPRIIRQRFDFGCTSMSAPTHFQKQVLAIVAAESISAAMPKIILSIAKGGFHNVGEIVLNQFAKCVAERIGDREYASKVQAAIHALGDYTYYEEQTQKGIKRHSLLSFSDLLKCFDLADKDQRNKGQVLPLIKAELEEPRHFLAKLALSLVSARA